MHGAGCVLLSGMMLSVLMSRCIVENDKHVKRAVLSFVDGIQIWRNTHRAANRETVGAKCFSRGKSGNGALHLNVPCLLWIKLQAGYLAEGDHKSVCPRPLSLPFVPSTCVVSFVCAAIPSCDATVLYVWAAAACAMPLAARLQFSG